MALLSGTQLKQEWYICTFEEWVLGLILFHSNKVYQSSLMGKVPKTPLLGKSTNATDMLALVHSETSGPMSS